MINKLHRFYLKLPNFPGKITLGNIFIWLVSLFSRSDNLTLDIFSAGGGKLICHLDDWIPRQIFLYGRYEIEKVHENFMINRVKNYTCIFDIGANIGYYTIQFGRSSKGDIHSFEGLSRNFNILKENIRINDLNNVKINHLLVTDKSNINKKIFFGGIQNTGSSSVIIPRNLSSEIVPTVTLDDYCHQKGIEHIDLIKIDVEGYEQRVLIGCEELLSTQKVNELYIEICREYLELIEDSPERLCEFMKSFGYLPYLITDQGLIDYPLNCPDDSLVYFTFKNT